MIAKPFRIPYTQNLLHTMHEYFSCKKKAERIYYLRMKVYKDVIGG